MTTAALQQTTCQVPANNSLNSAKNSAMIALSTVREGVAGKMKMSEAEYNENLKKHGLTRREACNLLYIKTGSVVNPDNIYTQLYRYGSLSNQSTALWRLFFSLLEQDNGTEQQRTAASGS